MTKRLFVVVFLVALASLPVTGQSRPASGPSIQGVWRIVEMTTTGPDGSTNKSPQPGLWIFTRQYSSETVVLGDEPRPDLPDAVEATADELRAVWGPFVGSAGTYELAGGNLLTFRYLVAKIPADMKSGTFATWSYKLEGNTLWATQKSDDTGPLANPITLKFTRVE